MNSLELYYKYCNDVKDLEDYDEKLFIELSKFFDVSYEVALNLWYVEQRSWCNAERFQTIIDRKDDHEFQSKIGNEGSSLFI